MTRRAAQREGANASRSLAIPAQADYHPSGRCGWRVLINEAEEQTDG